MGDQLLQQLQSCFAGGDLLVKLCISDRCKQFADAGAGRNTVSGDIVAGDQGLRVELCGFVYVKEVAGENCVFRAAAEAGIGGFGNRQQQVAARVCQQWFREVQWSSGKSCEGCAM